MVIEKQVRENGNLFFIRMSRVCGVVRDVFRPVSSIIAFQEQ